LRAFLIERAAHLVRNAAWGGQMSYGFAWIALVTAGLLDVAWAMSMKYADGYTRLGWSVLSLVLLALFVFLLGWTLKVLPVGIAYSVWTGIGAVGTVGMGVLLFGETLSLLQVSGEEAKDARFEDRRAR
jgi:quaternary ammonium compound-resistance protein SugE